MESTALSRKYTGPRPGGARPINQEKYSPGGGWARNREPNEVSWKEPGLAGDDADGEKGEDHREEVFAERGGEIRKTPFRGEHAAEMEADEGAGESGDGTQETAFNGGAVQTRGGKSADEATEGDPRDKRKGGGAIRSSGEFVTNELAQSEHEEDDRCDGFGSPEGPGTGHVEIASVGEEAYDSHGRHGTEASHRT